MLKLNVRSQRARDNFYQRVAELRGEVLELEWLGTKERHRCRCAEGHECRPRPGDVLQGGGICPVCSGKDPVTARDNFYKRIAALGGEVLEPEYLGSQKPHHCRCASGHECWPAPSSVRQGNGICLICAGKDPVTARDNFYRSVAEQGGVVLEPSWLGVGKPHLCRCANGHECRPSPTSVQQGRSICRTCAGSDPAVSRENFYRRVADKGGIVLEQRWLGARTPHRCLCVNGHECLPLPSGVRKDNSICRICSGHDSGAARDNFYRIVAEQGGTVLELEWLGNSKPHRVRCAEGHECCPTPGNVQQGHGICRACAGKDWNALYVVRDSATGWVKFGITGRDGRLRLSDHRRDGFTEALHLLTGLPEGLAVHTEQKIKLALAMAGAEPVRGREYFSDEYLALIENEISNWVVFPVAA
jgi:hypothetical protein